MGSTYARMGPPLRFGVATSAYQTEGELHATNWAAWERRRHPDGRPSIADGSRCGRATDSWARFDEDLACLVWLGVDTYRFSVEWSRVEPISGYIDDTALDRYRDWCVKLRTAGITPMVTLHHFSEPAWFSADGGFLGPGGTAAWLRFVRLVEDRLGDLVDEWVTINEPVGYVVQGWLRGVWPPGRSDPRLAARVLENLLLAHARAYQLLHQGAERRGASCAVGLAHHQVVFRPLTGRLSDRWAAHAVDASYNHAVPRALQTGSLRLRLPGMRHRARLPSLVGTQDFYGLNHYQPLYVSIRWPGGGPLSGLHVGASGRGERDDLELDIDPGSLADAVRAASSYGLPIHITENGTCDGATPDDRRRRQLTASLEAVEALRACGCDIRSYIHWTLVDNFEWAYGWSARFGLFQFDRKTGRRSPRAAAHLYRGLIARHRGVEDRVVEP